MFTFNEILQANPEALAIIPASYVWTAASCASTDQTKPSINEVCLRKAGDSILIYGTNGHYCFRASMQTGEHQDASCYIQSVEFKFNAKDFVKPGHYLKGGFIVFFEGGLSKLYGSKFSEIREYTEGRHECYPKIEQLWPDAKALACEPGLPLTFNAEYIFAMGKIAAKVAWNNSLSLKTASSISPVVWEAKSIYGDFGILLMPIQLQTPEAKLAEKNKADRDSKRASDAKELMAYRLQAKTALQVTA